MSASAPIAGADGEASSALVSLCRAAADLLVAGGDPASLVAELPPGPRALDLNAAATALADPISASLTGSDAEREERWQSLRTSLEHVLAALEERVGEVGLGRAIGTRVQRALLPLMSRALGVPIAGTHVVVVEMTAPIGAVTPPPGTVRLQLLVLLEDAVLGVVELPVCRGGVPVDVIRDAIADRFAWRVLGRFFERSVYADVALRQEGEQWSAWRGTNRVARDLPTDSAARVSALHDAIGWSVLIDELIPVQESVLSTAAYAIDRLSVKLFANTPGKRVGPSRWISVELSAPIAGRFAGGADLFVEVRVAGMPVVAFHAPTGPVGIISGRRLRDIALDAAGFELCRVVVREALIGAPLAGGGSLRERVAGAGARREAESLRAEPLHGSTPVSEHVAAGWADAVRRARVVHPECLVLSNRSPAITGTSASRHAVLPATAAASLRAASARIEAPVAEPVGGNARIVVYAPDALWRDRTMSGSQAELKLAIAPSTTTGVNPQARFEFESLFASGADPWRYSSEYEQTKYEQTLDILPSEDFPRALEIACAEGHFTVQLAPRVGTLLATDISELAIERAAERCRTLTNILYEQLDLATGVLPGEFNLIVCSEMLYFIGGRDRLPAVASTIAGALVPGGYFVTAHANVLADAPNETGYNWDVPFGALYIREVFSASPTLQLVRELRTPLYRVLLFRRANGSPAPVPETIECDNVAVPETAAAAGIRRGGGEVQRAPVHRVTTSRLPILMYHRVAPNGPPSRSRYRVSPELFARQMRYLRDSGYHSITLDEWRDATLARRPLDGRAVVITFDDGFDDFAQYAWPLLIEHGFSALVFLVAGRVGQGNTWDPGAFEGEPLMSWPTLERLRDEGVAFGAHSVTHPRMTMLSPEVVAREAADSRAMILQHLGVQPSAFAYPYGDHDESVRHLIGGCGFSYGLATNSARAQLHDSLLELPRFEIRGDRDFQSFVATLAG